VGKINWTDPENLKRLLTLPDDDLRQYYYWVEWGALKRTRRKYREKLRKVTSMEKEKSYEQEPSELDKLAAVFRDAGIDITAKDLEGASRAGYHVGFIRNAEGEIEYTKPLPNVSFGKRKQKALEDFISQADPVKITSNKRKPIQRDFRRILVFSDLQIDYRNIDGELFPLHDERVINIINMMCREYRPETIVDCSDTVDFAALSRFAPDSDHFRHSLNPAINRAHQLYAQLRADNPNSKIVAVDSNHTIRLAKFVLKQVPELYGIRQAGSDAEYPALSYPFLVNLEAAGVDWYGGYGAAEYVYGNEYNAPPIVFKHGVTVVSNGSTAAKESKENPETHIVRGHGHRAEVHHRTTRAGQYLTSMMIGCGCHTDGRVPSYQSGVDERGRVIPYQQNWQQSLAMITDYMDGNYQFDTVLIKDGVARYNGVIYDGSEDKKA
jgi:hypothetical protein